MWQADGLLARIYVGYVRMWNHPFKLRLAFFLARRIFTGGVPMRYATGARISVFANDFIGWSIIKTGSYEPQTIELMRSLLRDGGTFVDVGANFGLLSSVAASLSNVSVFSVEAHSGNFERLRQTKYENPGSRDWMLFLCAISDNKKFVEIEEHQDGNSGTHRVSAVKGESTSNAFRVACRTLNELVESEEITKIDVLKIDVEGYEFQVLQGIDFNKPTRPKNIILEFTDYGSRFGYSRKDVYDYLVTSGYELHDILGAKREWSDTFLEVNACFVDAA